MKVEVNRSIEVDINLLLVLHEGGGRVLSVGAGYPLKGSYSFKFKLIFHALSLFCITNPNIIRRQNWSYMHVWLVQRTRDTRNYQSVQMTDLQLHQLILALTGRCGGDQAAGVADGSHATLPPR